MKPTLKFTGSIKREIKRRVAADPITRADNQTAFKKGWLKPAQPKSKP